MADAYKGIIVPSIFNTYTFYLNELYALLGISDYNMRAIQLITTVACFAAVALAVPSPAKKAEQEAHLFKRGEPLTPEDLSLAEMHSAYTLAGIHISLMQQEITQEQQYTFCSINTMHFSK